MRVASSRTRHMADLLTEPVLPTRSDSSTSPVSVVDAEKKDAENSSAAESCNHNESTTSVKPCADGPPALRARRVEPRAAELRAHDCGHQRPRHEAGLFCESAQALPLPQEAGRPQRFAGRVARRPVRSRSSTAASTSARPRTGLGAARAGRAANRPSRGRPTAFGARTSVRAPGGRTSFVHATADAIRQRAPPVPLWCCRREPTGRLDGGAR